MSEIGALSGWPTWPATGSSGLPSDSVAGAAKRPPGTAQSRGIERSDHEATLVGGDLGLSGLQIAVSGMEGMVELGDATVAAHQDPGAIRLDRRDVLSLSRQLKPQRFGFPGRMPSGIFLLVPAGSKVVGDPFSEGIPALGQCFEGLLHPDQKIVPVDLQTGTLDGLPAELFESTCVCEQSSRRVCDVSEGIYQDDATAVIRHGHERVGVEGDGDSAHGSGLAAMRDIPSILDGHSRIFAGARASPSE